jgi:hypothetical protein
MARPNGPVPSVTGGATPNGGMRGAAAPHATQVLEAQQAFRLLPVANQAQNEACAAC